MVANGFHISTRTKTNFLRPFFPRSLSALSENDDNDHERKRDEELEDLQFDSLLKLELDS